MAVFIDEPTPISRADASKLMGTLTSMGLVASADVGVLARSYISAIYGNAIAKTGGNITLNPNNIMSVLDYTGRITPAISWLCYDSLAVNGNPPSAAFGYRIGFKVTTTPQGRPPATFSYGLKDLTGFLNPVSNPGFAVTNTFGIPGWIGQNFEQFGSTSYTITKADLVGGQLPNINIKIELYWGWLAVPPPSAVIQVNFTPAYQDNSITLPPPYYNIFSYPRSKPVTTRGFNYNNLSPLTTPYNILPCPYGGQVAVGNLPTTKMTLQAFYRQSPPVSAGGPSYVYVAGDNFPIAAKIFECDLNLKVFPPLYYVYGVDIATSTINWLFPSYSANPLDSRP